MAIHADRCPECEEEAGFLARREFLRAVGAGAAGAMAGAGLAHTAAALGASGQNAPETAVKLLYDSLTEAQRKVVHFDWEYLDPARGLLRTRVANNWRITPPAIKSDFFTPRQQGMIREIFEGIVQRDWIAKFDKQLADDAGGWGVRQSIAIFGRPGQGKFEFVLTGRHMTLRCDGHSAAHVAFGGPIFYGHAASGFYEKPAHPGNIFWPQALAANQVFHMLDGRQQKEALLDRAPAENRVAFQGPSGRFPGIPVRQLSPDQKENLQKVLQKLIDPYRQPDREEVLACLKKQGGLDHLWLAFYRQGDLGRDHVWDIWRLEGPAFVWHFRGAPHVHVWVNVADDPNVKFNA
jgi:Protein of unknown function (DUF3500)